MKISLLALMLLIAGCASNVEVREASTFFADYEVEQASSPVRALELPQLHQVKQRGNEVIMTAEAFDTLVEYETVAKANTEALNDLSEAYLHKERELYFLVLAGRQVETEAALFRQMYLNEAQQCQYYQYGVVGLGGLTLLLTGLAF